MLPVVLLCLWGLWEGYRWIWMTTGWTHPFTVDDLTMPHIHKIVGHLFSHTSTGQLLLDYLWHHALFTAKEAVVGFLFGAVVGFLLGVLLAQFRGAAARSDAVRRRLADDPDPRHRPDRRRRARERLLLRLDDDGLGAGRGDRGLSDVLPGHRQHDSRPPVRRPARARADALLRRERAGRSSGSCAFPRRCRTSSPRSRSRATASVVGAIIAEPASSIQDGLGGAIVNFNQYYSLDPKSLWATNLIAALLGIAFFLAVVGVEKLVVRRAPEHLV